jgi:hypothetical protein
MRLAFRPPRAAAAVEYDAVGGSDDADGRKSHAAAAAVVVDDDAVAAGTEAVVVVEGLNLLASYSNAFEFSFKVRLAYYLIFRPAFKVVALS